MRRTFAVSLALLAGISLAHAADDYQIKSAEQCHGIAKTLEGTLESSKASLPQDQLSEAEASIKALHDNCTKGDLVAASDNATSARQSLAAEN